MIEIIEKTTLNKLHTCPASLHNLCLYLNATYVYIDGRRYEWRDTEVTVGEDNVSIYVELVD